jgi:signal recognition particle receptor subunit beta
MDTSKVLDPFEWLKKTIELIVGAYKAWRGFRLVVFGTTRVGKSTFWEYLQTEQLVPKDSLNKTIEISKFQKFRLRSIKLSFIKVGVLATDLPGDLQYRHTWEAVLKEVKPHGIIFMIDNADIKEGGSPPESGFDPTRLKEHNEAFGDLLNILFKYPDVTKKLHAFMILVNKSDTFPNNLGGYGRILDESGIMDKFNKLKNYSEFENCRTIANHCSAMYGNNIQEMVKWLVRNM